ncbi:MAG: putative SAM-depedent methyltransferase [Myxococcales bacterium]|nr:putative SAM-depedent methyltransferase [Myxococcales bacterium]
MPRYRADLFAVVPSSGRFEAARNLPDARCQEFGQGIAALGDDNVPYPANTDRGFAMVRTVTDFVFATCLPDMEPALKREVARTRPELRFAYSRPGLVTFKSDRAVTPEDVTGSAFARVWGRSIGPARDPADAAHQLAYVGANRVHVFARDPEGVVDLESWREAIASATGIPAGSALPGELVADVIVAPGEPAWLGLHRHGSGGAAEPGGAIAVEVPAEAPSRAYAKIEEAIAWGTLPVEAGQVALEIGAAPGGAVLALARRGVTVWGVDTGDLAPAVLAQPNVHHLQIKVGALRWEQLPARIDWLLVDVNLAPQVALHEIARLMPKLRPTLRGAVFTLKLNDWSFVDELPALGDRIIALGFASVRFKHLPSNRREVCAIARS